MLKKRLLRLKKSNSKVNFRKRFNFFDRNSFLLKIKNIAIYPSRVINSMSNTTLLIVLMVIIVVLVYIITSLKLPQISASSQSVMDIINSWNKRQSIIMFNAIGLIIINWIGYCKSLGDFNPPFMQK